MKKIFSLFAAVLFAGSMFAADVTISPSDFTAAENADYSTTKSGVTVAVTASTVTADQMRIFKGKTITISAASNITKIVFTCTANGTAKYGPGCFAAQDGYTFDASGKTGTWEGSATSVTFTAESNQVRATEIVVTLADGGDTPQEDTWTVAGSSTVAFGTSWDPTNAANDMVKQNDGTFKWEKENLELADGSVDFKVAKNHSWDEAYPSQDYKLAIDAAGIYTITITFEPENNNNVSAIATKTGEAVVVPTVIMHGTFTGSWADTEAFATADDKKTASLKLTLNAGDIEFGMKFDGAWKANGATITRENASTSLASGEGNMHLTADVAGDYTFTYTYETQTLAVTFPAMPISLTEFITNKPAEAVTLKDLTVIFATGKNTYVIDEDGVALVIYDANKTYYDGTLAAGKVLSGQKATYTSYKNQDEIIPANAANVSDGTAPEAELRTEAPTVADINKFIAFNNVAAEKASNNNYYIFDGTVQLYFASSSDKPSEDGNYDVEGVFINYNSTQLELIVTAIEKSKGTAIDNATVAGKAQKMIIDGQLFIIRDGVMFNANGAAVK